MPVSSWNDSFANPTFARSRNARMYISSRKGTRRLVALLMAFANVTAEPLSTAISGTGVTIAYCLHRMTMRLASAALALLTVVVVAAQPTHGVLRITITLIDAGQASTPVRRHVLLVSDDPPSAAPRAIPTGADGTAVISLRPGSYIVESDEPVTFGGRAYQWRQHVEIVAGRDFRVDFTADNAEIVPLEMVRPTMGGASRDDALLEKHRESVVAVWSPTARVSGFVVDPRGLIATEGRAIDAATVVEVQLSPTMKVPASVLVSERSRDVAIVRVDPSVVATRPALEVACPPSPTPTVHDGHTIATIAVPHDAEKEL